MSVENCWEIKLSKIIQKILVSDLSMLTDRSIDHALIEVISSIYGSFSQNKYTSGVFTDLSKAFDLVGSNSNIKTINLKKHYNFNMQTL